MRTALPLAAGLVALLINACSQTDTPNDTAPAAIRPDELAIFAPLPEVIRSTTNPVTTAKIDLGRRLYYETLLSSDHRISCNSCHVLAAYGADGRRLSPGDRGHLSERNTPTVYNAAGNVAQTWDGRAGTVEEQALGPILNPTEMAMADSSEVVAHLRADPTYVASFRSAFPGVTKPVTFTNVGLAIGAFERGLVVPSRWDSFLQGDTTALTTQEREGFIVFLRSGCASCHYGMLIGGSSFQKVGVARPWPAAESDSGRFALTRELQDVMVFKVPSLRNVTMTPPYFHDGSVRELDQAVQRMARYQLGRELASEQLAAIVAWLDALTGEIPIAYIAYPPLPSR